MLIARHDDDVDDMSKSECKMLLEFKSAFYDVAVQYVSHYATGTHPKEIKVLESPELNLIEN